MFDRSGIIRIVSFSFMAALLLGATFATARFAFGASSGGWINASLVYSDNLNDENWPSIATDNSGSIYVAYQHYNSTLMAYRICISKSVDAGNTWTLFHQIEGNTNRLHPSIAIDPYDNTLYVAYEKEIISNQHDIMISIYKSSSGWNETVVTDPRGLDDRYPHVVSDYQFGTNNYQYLSYETIQSDGSRDVNVHRSTDHGSSWPLWHEWNYETEPVTTRTQTSITTSQDGTVFLAFVQGSSYTDQKKLFVHYGSRNNNDSVFENRISLADSFGVPAGASWPSICASHSDPLKVVIAFQLYRTQTNDDVCYAYTADGGIHWNWGTISNTNQNERYPALTVDGQGSTSSNVSGYFRVAFYSDQQGFQVLNINYKQASDLVLFTWTDYTEGSNPIVTSSGTWEDAQQRGLAITTQEGNNTWWPNMVWTDHRGGSYDVYSITQATNPIVPEFTSHLTVILLAAVTVLVVIISRKRRF